MTEMDHPATPGNRPYSSIEVPHQRARVFW